MKEGVEWLQKGEHKCVDCNKTREDLKRTGNYLFMMDEFNAKLCAKCIRARREKIKAEKKKKEKKNG